MVDHSLDILEQLKNQSHTVDQAFSSRELSKSSFCVMPFVNIILEPNGEVGVCRHKGTKFTFGNIKDQSLDEIWQSERMQAWRQELLSGEVDVCKKELIDMKCNQCPELNKLLPMAELDVKNPKILRLTANLNGKCNLQCQMCDVWKMPNGFYTEENFWKPARERFFKDIQEVDLLSGEPFIQADTYKLINEISAVNPDCQWTFTTNLHWKLTDKIKEQLDRIKIKNMILSIDSLDHAGYAKIRRLGDLSFVLNNVEELLRYQEERVSKGLGSLSLRLNCVVQQDNWHEMKNIIKFCIERKIIPFVTFLYFPESFSLLSLEHEERKKILNFYFETLTPTEMIFAQRVVRPLVRSLEKMDYIQFLDKMRESSL
nr:SPASM domain-containing protein [Bacteriovorax sp. HI3]